MNPGAWTLLGSWAAGTICVVVGTVCVLRAAARTKKHANAIVPEALVAKALAAEDAAARLQGSLTLIESLVPRITAALEESALALRELRSAFSLRR